MPKRSSVLFFVLGSIFQLAALPKLAVLDVLIPSGIEREIIVPVTETIMEELVSSKAYTVLDRAYIEQILKEKEFQLSGLVDDSQVTSAGRFLGADYVVAGRIQMVAGSYFLVAKMIEVESGAIKAQSSEQAAGALLVLIDAARKIGKKLADTGAAETPAVATASRAKPFRIGIVFDVGGKGDKSFNDSAYEGLVAIANAFKGRIDGDPSNVDFGSRVVLKYLEPKQGGQDRELLLRVLAEDGYDLVFGVGFMFTDSIAKVARDFRATHFALIDGYAPDLARDSNLTCLSFSEEQGSFLVGALSGLMTANKAKAKVGFIGGMDIPLIHKFQAGFVAGAAYSNKNLRKDGMIQAQYIGKDPAAFNDPKTASSIASAMYKSGVEIIYHASGGSGTGLFESARLSGKLAIGVDSDQGLGYMTNYRDPAAREVGKFILSSMMKRVDNAVFLTAKELIETGDVAGGYRGFSLADGGVGYALNDFNRAALAPYIASLDSLKAKIISGQIVVPSDDAQAAAFIKALR